MKKYKYTSDNKELVSFYCDVCGEQILKEEQKRSIQTGVDTHICSLCKQDPLVEEQEDLTHRR